MEVVGICALLFSVGLYIVHDRKLKQQQKVLNEYQLKVVEQNKKAEVRVAIINKQSDRLGNKSGTLVIKNYGKATAYNVRIEQELYTEFSVVKHYYQQILPQEKNETDVKYQWDTDRPVVVTWDDESGKNRTYKCTLDW